MGYTDAPVGWWRDFVLSTPAQTAKLGVVRADGAPHVAPVCAAVSTDPGELLRWATRIGGRYMAAGRADEYGRRNAVLPEMVERVAPVKVVAKINIAD